MYRLRQWLIATGISGRALRAGPADRALVKTWLADFHSEAITASPARNLEAAAEHRLAAAELWLWVDVAKPVSLAGHSAPAGGVSWVGPVYPPPGRPAPAEIPVSGDRGGATPAAQY